MHCCEQPSHSPTRIVLTLQRSELLSRLCRVEAQELGELGAVLRILVNAELDVLAERLVELVEVIFVLRDLGEEVHALLDEVLADDLEDLVLLEGLTRDVKREILGVDDTLDEVEVLGDEVLAVVHDEDAADVELDVVALLLLLEEVEGRAEREEDQQRRNISAERTMPLTASGRRGSP